MNNSIDWTRFATLQRELVPYDLTLQPADGGITVVGLNDGGLVARLTTAAGDRRHVEDPPAVVVTDHDLRRIVSPHWQVPSLAAQLLTRLAGKRLRVKGCLTLSWLVRTHQLLVGLEPPPELAITLAASGAATGTIKVAVTTTDDGAVLGAWELDVVVDGTPRGESNVDVRRLGLVEISGANAALPGVDPHDIAVRRAALEVAALLCAAGDFDCPVPVLRLVDRATDWSPFAAAVPDLSTLDEEAG